MEKKKQVRRLATRCHASSTEVSAALSMICSLILVRYRQVNETRMAESRLAVQKF